MCPEIEKAVESLKSYRKECSEKKTIGERTLIEGVECVLHFPCEDNDSKPAFLLMHGGTWIGGDAVVIDSLTETLAAEADCLGVNINYTKVDEKPFPFAMEQAVSVINHLRHNSEKYGIDPDRIYICGCSAGAHLAAGTAVLCRDRNIKIKRQILVYPFTDFTGYIENPLYDFDLMGASFNEWEKIFFSELDKSSVCLSPGGADESELRGLAPADIIVCGKDILRKHGTVYYEKLKKAGVEATLREYENALHGFLETNRPDFFGENPSIGGEQAEYARDCEKYLISIVKETRI